MSHRCLALLCALSAAAIAAAQRPTIVAGTGAGVAPQVRVFDGTTFSLLSSFVPYDAAFLGGVRVATGDVNGDGVADVITGSGAGVAGGHVKVFDGRDYSLMRSFFAFETAYQGGVSVGAADIDGDGKADLIVGAESATSHVKVFDGATGDTVRSFFAFDQDYNGGVTVAGGDLDGDGRADLVVGSAGASSHVKVFDGQTLGLSRSLIAFDAPYAGGVNVAAADLDGDGGLDVLAGAADGSSHVRGFSPAGSVLTSLIAFGDGSVRVAGYGSGRGSRIVAGSSLSSDVRLFDPLTGAESARFEAFSRLGTGIYVAAGGSPVPEPAPLAALVVGLAAMWRRRRALGA